MAAQPEDTKTPDLFDQIAEDNHLAQDHKLIPVRAYIRDPKAADKKSAVAERVKKMRERDKAAGLVMHKIPVTVAEAIKESGGDFNAWLASQAKATQPQPQLDKEKPVPAPVEKVVEKIVEVPVEKIVEKRVPAELSKEDRKALDLGLRVQRLKGWRRALLNWLL